MCSFEDVCLAYSDGDCPLVRNDAEDDCPGRFVSFCKFCIRCEWHDTCKKECELENETLQN